MSHTHNHTSVNVGKRPTGKHPNIPQDQNAGRKAPISWAEKVKVTNAATTFTLEPLPRPPTGHQLVIPEEVQNLGCTDRGSRARAMVVWRETPNSPAMEPKVPISHKQNLHPTGVDSPERLAPPIVLEYARICVEIDAKLPYVHQFEVLTPLSTSPIPIQVDYEWKPTQCSTCKVFGHACIGREDTARVPDPQLVNKGNNLSPIQICTHPQILTHPRIDLPSESSQIPKTHRITLSNTTTEHVLIKPPVPLIHGIRPDISEATTNPTEEAINISDPLTQKREIDSTKAKAKAKEAIYMDNRTDTVHSHSSQNEDMGETSSTSTKPRMPQLSQAKENPSPPLKTLRKKKVGRIRRWIATSRSVQRHANKFMFSIGSWSIRGINHPKKQKTVREWTKKKLDIIGLLEVKIASSNLPSIIEGLSLDNWGHLSNDDGRNPSRILIGWNKETCNLTSIHSSPQWLTCEVSTLNNSSLFRITFIYGQSTPARRVDLWNYITQHHFAFSSKPWLIQGDFNAIMGRNDRSGGSTAWHDHQDDFS
ncbi:hypothetical protein OIU85_008741 [Salix viminalis]|uniref:DUF4283 domain-containing protein n=1 Tax=Salix viminalis TaxID=40686 RepID=A0A9Q0NYD0_SALVM|nr:hypothetical protein OIU85_008741 [Salix viminalis]